MRMYLRIRTYVCMYVGGSMFECSLILNLGLRTSIYIQYMYASMYVCMYVCMFVYRKRINSVLCQVGIPRVVVCDIIVGFGECVSTGHRSCLCGGGLRYLVRLRARCRYAVILQVCMYVCMFVRVCIHVCMYVCMYVCTLLNT